MRKIALSLVLVFILALLAGCTGDVQVADGIYRAEYADYNARGYKEFVEITFENGEITDVVFDAVSGVDGTLFSESEEMKVLMQSNTGTYPQKYLEDLVNQYKQNPDADSIDIVAGATESTQAYVVLAKALEKSIRAGYTDTVIVGRP